MPEGTPRISESTVLQTPTLVTTAETVIAILPGISDDLASDPVEIYARADITPGTTTSQLVLKVRRGTTTAGAQVGNSSQTDAAATVLQQVDITVQDTPGEVANQQYCLTATQTGATANGTVADTLIRALY